MHIRLVPAALILLLPLGCGDDGGTHDGDSGNPTTGPASSTTEVNPSTTGDPPVDDTTSTTDDPPADSTGSTSSDSGDDSSSGGEPIDPLAGAEGPVLVATVGSFLEGPAWSDDEQALFFSSTSESAIYRLEPKGPPMIFASDQGSNGLAFGADGRLHVAAAGFDEIRRLDALDGSGPQTLTGDFDGHAFDFNQPNDLDVSADGSVYFSDPCFSCGKSPAVYGLYRWSEGTVTSEDEFDASVENPNGVVLSPAQDWLYVAGSNDGMGQIWRYAVQGDGSLGEREPFVSLTGFGDGLAVDVAGNLYAASELGIEVFAPDGGPWGALGLDGLENRAFNCAFGGADRRSLYVAANSSLLRFDLMIAGAPD